MKRHNTDFKKEIHNFEVLFLRNDEQELQLLAEFFCRTSLQTSNFYL